MRPGDTEAIVRPTCPSDEFLSVPFSYAAWEKGQEPKGKIQTTCRRRPTDFTIGEDNRISLVFSPLDVELDVIDCGHGTCSSYADCFSVWEMIQEAKVEIAKSA